MTSNWYPMPLLITWKKHLPLKNTFLKDLHVLDRASRTKPDSVDTMIRVARAIPKLLNDIEIDHIRYECMTYAAENIDESCYIKRKYQDSNGNNHVEHHRIDYYWNKVLWLTTVFGLPKYPRLSKVVQNLLIISHGNLRMLNEVLVLMNIVLQKIEHCCRYLLLMVFVQCGMQ